MKRMVTVASAAATALALIQVPAAQADGDSRVARTDKGLVSGTATSTYPTFGNCPTT